MLLDHVRRMARYNRWANTVLYDACARLDALEYHAPRPAFFGSLHGTLCHLLVVDRIWIDRIEGRPYGGQKLDDQPFADLIGLRAAREAMDEEIVAVTRALQPADLEGDLVYRMIVRPETASLPKAVCWAHLFNHQTHHRGQAHDQLTQTPVAPPSLDLIYFAYAERAER